MSRIDETTTTDEKRTAGQNEAARDAAAPDTAVTLIGLGLMGQALGASLLAHGRTLTVWNRSREKAAALAASGARVADDAAAAVGASPVTLVCVLDYDAVRTSLEPAAAAGLLKGRTIINLTSGSPTQAREMAAWIDQQGATYLDGAIMTVPQTLGRPDALLIYSGAADAFDTYRALLSPFGGGTTFVGADAGLAATYDLALLSPMYTLYDGYLHALALLRAAKVDNASYVPLATTWLTSVLSWMPQMARDVETRRFETDVSTLSINLAGLDHIIAASVEAGVTPEPHRPLRALVERRIAEGRGNDGFASLIDLYDQRSSR